VPDKIGPAVGDRGPEKDGVGATTSSNQIAARKQQGGARHRRKGDRCEREIVALHLALGREECPLVWECKSRKAGGGFVQLERWLGENDLLFLRRDHAEPLVLLPWRVWARLLAKVRP
jgi:hypothetical protein